MRTIKYLLVLFVTISGCIEEYDLNLQDMNTRLVVEGLISNKPGPYYIRLTESHTGEFPEMDHSATDRAKGIMNATIIVSDNVNQIDTLVPVEIPEGKLQYNQEFGYHFQYIFDSNGKISDTIIVTDPLEFTDDRGYYKTQNLKGVPGRTYFLKVVSNGNEYHASDYMSPVPEIDSVGYLKKVMEKDGQIYFVPLLYFKEPQDTSNYYLIQLQDEILSRRYSENFNWRFSILSDEFLQPYVNGLNVSLGANPRGFEYPEYWEGANIYVALSSLSETAYNFYKVLFQQFKDDGGAYQFSPGSPPSNIDNGGLGFFRASAISEGRTKIDSNLEFFNIKK